jgi:hypothetical protein
MKRKRKLHQRGSFAPRRMRQLASQRDPDFLFFQRAADLYAGFQPDEYGRLPAGASRVRHDFERLMASDPVGLYPSHYLRLYPWLERWRRHHVKKRRRAKVVISGETGKLVGRIIHYLGIAETVGARLTIADLIALISSSAIEPTPSDILWALQYLNKHGYRLMRQRPPGGDRYYLAKTPPSHWLTDRNPKLRGHADYPWDDPIDIPFGQISSNIPAASQRVSSSVG